MDNIQDTTVLLIDDNIANLQVTMDLLELIGYEVLIAKSGAEGIERAELAEPSVILLDGKMPEMDGFETCRRLKSQEKTKEIPVIFISGLSEPEDHDRARDVGADDFLVRPFSAEDLKGALKKALD